MKQQCEGNTNKIKASSTEGSSMVTGQLADRPTRGQPSRGQAYSRTSQLAESTSRTQDDSHTGQLAHESARRQ